MNAPPLVSCIMPTANRRAFVPRAIQCFLRQDYPEKELVILDDGEDSVADLVPPDPRIRYLRETRRRTIGAKRNALCEEARGELIAHWDDDDWYPKDRISRQARALDEGAADIIGSSRVYFLDGQGGRAWEYRYTGPRQPYVLGSTLVYRRTLWQRNRFPDRQIGEDASFVWSAVPKRLVDLADPGLCVAAVHPTNTSTKRPAGCYWTPADAAGLRSLIDADEIAEMNTPEPWAPHACLSVERFQGVSVVIPHAGRERLPLLAATLASLRQSKTVTEIIVAEMGDRPVAEALASRWADKHLFIEHRGPFERARALNAGTAAASYDIVFWHDNDLVYEDALIGRSAEEMRTRQLDFLVPYSVVHYLGEPDSQAVMRGERSPSECQPVRSLRSSGEGGWWIGCIGAVRRAFVQRHGALIEGFRGWGGEDDAWFHKVRLLGRVVATERQDQEVFHLHHPLSGGTAPGKPGAANPFYGQNLALLQAVRSARSASDLAARFPPQPPVSGRLAIFARRRRHDREGLSVWTYWEGASPTWIRACRRTLVRHVPELRLLDPDTFERLRAQDPDRGIDLSHLHVAHRADFIRAYLLQRFGGLWIDADCLVMGSLAPALALLREHDFIGHRARGGVISNAFIGASKDSRIAAAYYRRVRHAVATKQRFSWNWLGGDLLTEVVAQDSSGWYELAADLVQPICWSRPQDFLAERDAAAHEGLVNPASWTYMLSNVELGKRFPEASGREALLQERTFFSHLLHRSLGGVDVRPSIVREGVATAQAEQFRGHHCESISGTGSSLQQTAVVRQRLPFLLEHLGARRLLDAPCGDLHWMREMNLGTIEYIGVDILSELIAAHRERNSDPHRIFICADLLTDALPAADAILCRDLLPHLSFFEIAKVLRRFVESGASHVIMTHFHGARPNQDTSDFAWRPLNFELKPFNFPPPMLLLSEKCTEDGGAWRDKSLGVWRLKAMAGADFLVNDSLGTAANPLRPAQ